MFPNQSFHHARRARRSSALVITLAVLVLISTIILMFLNQGLLNRQISFSSAGQYRADTAAHTAMDTIIGDLRTEIAAGSTAYTSNNITIYLPKANLSVIPYKSVSVLWTNMITQSAGTSNFWVGDATTYDSTMYNPVRATMNSTATASANGRYIKINSWNKTGLMGDPGSDALPAIPAAYTSPPDWILITRQGALSNALAMPAMSVLKDKSTANANYVLGRYAYIIYDEGGLIDANVAGFPSSVSGTDFPSKRGVLPQVDLANIPGIDTSAHANSLVTWRNTVSAASATAYTNYVLSSTNGFTVTAAGDQSFVSRRDLISYVQANTGIISTSALQYLGTYSRDLNAPSYTPSTSRARTQSGQGYRYGTDPGDLDDQFNPSLINLRVTTAFTRDSDNSTANPGEPLIKYRFPLSRLAWIGHTGPNGATAAQIMSSFGLSYSAGVWTYNHGTAGKILKLSDIAGTREPDFFELLQAGIAVGSLGKNATSYSNDLNFDANTYYQIMQIGANLIDQADPDSFPTRISFDSSEFDGIENLPYIDCVFESVYRLQGASEPATHPNLGFWYLPRLWNPHGQAGILPPAGTAPTRFRFKTSGNTTVSAVAYNPSGPTVVASNSFPDTGGSTLNPNSGITFDNSTSFAQPSSITAAMGGVANGPNDSISETNPPANTQITFLGICAGLLNVPDSRVTNTTINTYIYVTDVAQPYITHELQFWDAVQNQWVTYNRIKNVAVNWGFTDTQNDSKTVVGSNPGDAYRAYKPQMITMRIGEDPRTDRFGVIFGFMYWNGPFGNAPFYDPTAKDLTHYTMESIAGNENSFAAQAFAFSLGVGWSGNNAFFAGVPRNDGFYLSYGDPDGTYRRGDGAYTPFPQSLSATPDPTTINEGFPLAADAANSVNSRPIVLNRPFRSVGEMGYASRNAPWKSIDFFTPESADTALLDLFCVNESPKPPVIAGRLNLNTQQPIALRAALVGAIKSENDNSVITATSASTSEGTYYATGLAALTAGSPLINRSELATRWVGTSVDPYSGAYANGTFSSYQTNIAPVIPTYGAPDNGPDFAIKHHREASVRALAEVGTTRTWNLLIDVIAQSGRYAPNATNLNQFWVEGERRYWLHVAIDRYTGKVISQVLEPVYE